MIAFTKWFLRQERKPISLARPGDFILVRGAPAERIFAFYDKEKRMRKLVVHTRDAGPSRRPNSRRRF